MDDPADSRRGAAQDRIVDGGLVVVTALVGFYVAANRWEAPPTVPLWVLHLDHVAGVLGCLALWWRRRFPLVLAVVLALLGTFSESVSFAALVALFTVAVHRSARATAVLAVGSLLSSGVYQLLRPEPVIPLSVVIPSVISVHVAAVVWGLLRTRCRSDRRDRQRAAAHALRGRRDSDRLRGGAARAGRAGHARRRPARARADQFRRVAVGHAVAVAGVSRAESSIVPTIDVLVADDDPVVRFGLAMMLRGATDLRVVAEAGDGAEAVELADRLAPQRGDRRAPPHRPGHGQDPRVRDPDQARPQQPRAGGRARARGGTRLPRPVNAGRPLRGDTYVRGDR
jgi:hypothetical protein